MVDARELAARQREVASLLLAAGDDEVLLNAARNLASTLKEVVDDDGLWAALADGAREPLHQGQLALLVSLDWPTVLAQIGYEPPPPAELVAWELAGLASAAQLSTDSDEWTELRDKLRWLGDRIGEDVGDPAPAKDRSWWRRLRHKVGFGFSVLRRVSISALLVGAGEKAVEHAVEYALGAALGSAAFGPATAIAAVAVSGLASAALSELREAWQAETAARSSDRNRLAAVLGSPALSRARARFHAEQLMIARDGAELVADSADSVPGAADDLLNEIVDDVRKWAAAVGVELANAWALVAAHTARAGTAFIDTAVRALGQLRVALVDLVDGLRSGGLDHVPAAVEAAEGALGAVSDAVSEVRAFLQEQGLVPHP